MTPLKVRTSLGVIPSIFKTNEVHCKAASANTSMSGEFSRTSWKMSLEVIEKAMNSFFRFFEYVDNRKFRVPHSSNGGIPIKDSAASSRFRSSKKSLA